MSIRGTIFPAEASKNYEEMVSHLSKFVEVTKKEEATVLEERLLKQIDMVKQYFLLGGSLTLEATRTLIAIKKKEKKCWAEGMKMDTCSSKDLGEKVAAFWKSSAKKEGWIISQYVAETATHRPHQMPILFEKVGNGIHCTTFDTRMNFEGIRTPLLGAFSPLSIPVRIYLSTQKQQHDWSTCSHVSLENLHQLDHLGTSEFYKFMEEHHDSIEVQKDKKWTLIVSKRLPLYLMRLTQSMADFREYMTWALENVKISKEEMDKFKDKMSTKNPSWEKTAFDNVELNNRIVNRFRKNITKLIQRILNDKPPIKTSDDKI